MLLDFRRRRREQILDVAIQVFAPATTGRR
jgi:hypothetical protein